MIWWLFDQLRMSWLSRILNRTKTSMEIDSKLNDKLLLYCQDFYQGTNPPWKTEKIAKDWKWHEVNASLSRMPGSQCSHVHFVFRFYYRFSICHIPSCDGSVQFRWQVLIWEFYTMRIDCGREDGRENCKVWERCVHFKYVANHCGLQLQDHLLISTHFVFSMWSGPQDHCVRTGIRWLKYCKLFHCNVNYTRCLIHRSEYGWWSEMKLLARTISKSAAYLKQFAPLVYGNVRENALRKSAAFHIVCRTPNCIRLEWLLLASFDWVY